MSVALNGRNGGSPGVVLGSRVVRGPDWPSARGEGANGPGTVFEIKTDRLGELARVRWDNGEVSLHRNGNSNKFDLRAIDAERAVSRQGPSHSDSLQSIPQQQHRSPAFSVEAAGPSSSRDPTAAFVRITPLPHSDTSSCTPVEKKRKLEKEFFNGTCSFCNKEFKSKAGIKGHMAKQHAIKNWPGDYTQTDNATPGPSGVNNYSPQTSTSNQVHDESSVAENEVMDVNMLSAQEEDAFGKTFAVLMRTVPAVYRSEVMAKVANIITEYTARP